MINLYHEAKKISEELENVVFIGALAVISHTKSGRTTRDLDLVMAAEISDDELESKNYKIMSENGREVKYSPRGFKVDIYNKRDVNGISIETILDKSITFEKGKKYHIKVASLEVMIVSKYRANRSQDREDLNDLIRYNLTKIKWSVVQELTTSVEFERIKKLEKLISEELKL